MRLMITRHGQTVDNINRILQGQAPGKLTETGIAQAKKLAESIKDEHIDVIYSSDLKRASDTTAEITKYHPKTSVILTKDLRERDFREYVGKPYEAVDWDNLPDDVESNVEMRERIKRTLDEAYEKHPDKTVLIVCHGGVIKVLISIIHDFPVEKIEEIEKHGNTALTIIEMTEDKDHVVHLLNNQDHLE